MAVDNAAKKTQFINNVRSLAGLLTQVRYTASQLRDLRASDPVISAIGDADCLVPTGTANSYLTVAIIDNFLAGVTLDIEKALTNQNVTTLNRLPNLLAAQGA